MAKRNPRICIVIRPPRAALLEQDGISRTAMTSSVAAKKSVLQLFPTFVWVFELPTEVWEPVNRSVMMVLAGMADRLGAPDGLSRQSDTDLHLRPEFQGLARVVLEAGREVADYLMLKDHPLFISGCWANFSAPNAQHHQHSHPNNLFSAVYYVNAPARANTISFHDPRDQAHVIAPPLRARSPRTASSITVDTAPGRLIVFPAWLQHSVAVNHSNQMRISIALNLMLEDYALELSKPRFKNTLNEYRGGGRSD